MIWKQPRNSSFKEWFANETHFLSQRMKFLNSNGSNNSNHILLEKKNLNLSSKMELVCLGLFYCSMWLPFFKFSSLEETSTNDPSLSSDLVITMLPMIAQNTSVMLYF